MKVFSLATGVDTPYHSDHVRDNILNAGCYRCAPFLRRADPMGASWQAHRDGWFRHPKEPNATINGRPAYVEFSE